MEIIAQTFRKVFHVLTFLLRPAEQEEIFYNYHSRRRIALKK